MDRFFRLDLPVLVFARNVLVLSLLGLVPLLAVFVLRTPGFAELLLGNGEALRLFLRQVVTNGLPVVFVVNYASLFFFAALAEGRRLGPGLVLLGDPLLRVVLFVGLHALIYPLSADWFGSFGGDRMLALHVVGPTLVRSAQFGNISGVYLYATLAGALPLYAAAMTRMGWLRWPLALGVFALAAALLTGAAELIVRLQG